MTFLGCVPFFAPRQVEFRVNEDAPTRPVPVKLWLKETGKLPLGGHNSNSGSPSYDDRAASSGGCDSPGHFEGCQIIYVKVRVTRASVGMVYGTLLCLVCWRVVGPTPMTLTVLFLGAYLRGSMCRCFHSCIP